MKNKIGHLLIISIFVILSSCNSQREVKISEINSVCEKLPEFNNKTGEGSKNIFFEGYLFGVENPSGSKTKVRITEDTAVSEEYDAILHEDKKVTDRLLQLDANESSKYIHELSKKEMLLSIDVGTENNQLQFVDQNNFTVKTSTGETLGKKDKVRILGSLSKTTFPDSTLCYVIPLRIDKP